MAMKFTNNATTTLASNITSSATSLTVSASSGSLFPTLSGSDYFYCTLANTSGAIEIVKVTARSTDTFTITRGQDGTSGQAWNSGDKVELRLVAASLNDIPKLDEANTFTALQTLSVDATINGATIGSGGGNFANNFVAGNGSLGSNTTGTDNSAFGYNALSANTTGQDNSSVGFRSLYTNTTGAYNTAIGSQALRLNTTASNNTAVGYQAGYSNTTGTGQAIFGYQSGYLTTGNGNTLLGNSAGYYVTSGVNNTYVGNNAGSNIAASTGQSNTGISGGALVNNTTGSNNTAVGYQAGYNNKTGFYNTFIGHSAGYYSTAGDNVFVGQDAGFSVTTGNYNTFIGRSTYGAGQNVTTGSKNTIIGGYNGNQGGLDIRTASNYIVLSDGDGNPRITCAGAYVGIGSTAPGGTSQNGVIFQPSGWGTNKTYTSVIGASSSNGEFAYELFSSSLSQSQFYVGYGGTVYARSTSITGLSDITEKENIKPLETGLSEILALQPRRFDWKNGSKQNVAGFIAQEVELILPDLIEDYILNKETSETKKGLKMGDMMPTLVKAIQELKTIVDAQAARIATLESR